MTLITLSVLQYLRRPMGQASGGGGGVAFCPLVDTL
jgi:hypothetical protein